MIKNREQENLQIANGRDKPNKEASGCYFSEGPPRDHTC